MREKELVMMELKDAAQEWAKAFEEMASIMLDMSSVIREDVLAVVESNGYGQMAIAFGQCLRRSAPILHRKDVADQRMQECAAKVRRLTLEFYG